MEGKFPIVIARGQGGAGRAGAARACSNQPTIFVAQTQTSAKSTCHVDVPTMQRGQAGMSDARRRPHRGQRVPERRAASLVRGVVEWDENKKSPEGNLVDESEQVNECHAPPKGRGADVNSEGIPQRTRHPGAARHYSRRGTEAVSVVGPKAAAKKWGVPRGRNGLLLLSSAIGVSSQRAKIPAAGCSHDGPASAAAPLKRVRAPHGRRGGFQRG